MYSVGYIIKKLSYFFYNFKTILKNELVWFYLNNVEYSTQSRKTSFN